MGVLQLACPWDRGTDGPWDALTARSHLRIGFGRTAHGWTYTRSDNWLVRDIPRGSKSLCSSIMASDPLTLFSTYVSTSLHHPHYTSLHHQTISTTSTITISPPHHIPILTPPSAWVDDHLVGTGKVSKGMIIGKQGGIWAKTPGYEVSACMRIGYRCRAWDRSRGLSVLLVGVAMVMVMMVS